MAGNDLRILVSASLNVGKSISDLNQSIQAIEKHPSLRKIKLKIDIDQTFTNSLINFKHSIEQVTLFINKQNTTISNSTHFINQETKAINEATVAQKKWNQEKQKTISDGSGNPVSVQSTFGNNFNNNKQIVDSMPDGSIRKITNVVNQKKDLQDALKAEKVMLDEAYRMNTEFDKKAEVLDKAHYQALKTNKERSEAQDKLHYLALKQNREFDLKVQQEYQKQAEAIDKAHYQALKTEKEKKEALDKQHFLAIQQNARREDEFLKQKANLSLKISDLRRRFGNDLNITKSLDVVESQLKPINSIGNYKKSLDEIGLSINKIGTEARTSGSHVTGMGEAFNIAISRTLLWGVATTAIYGTKKAIEEMIKTIIELDSQMIHLKRVMDADTNFDQMLMGSMNMANQLGQKVTDINKALITAAQAGYKANDALDITKTSVIASNVSEMSPEQAMSDMIAAMKAFNIEAKDSIQIVDKLNEVDNNYSVSSRNLADAVTHAGAAAKTYGVTLDELIGYTTAIGEVTRESGSVIGNMEKSVFSRLYSQASISALKEVNVQVLDMNGQNRKASEILSDLGTRWNFLTSTQQANVGVTVAGRNQLTRFLALMNNWDTATKATQTSINSQGSAMRENEEYMKSMQAQINQLSTAWEQLSYTMGQSGVKKLFTDIISSLTSMTQGFNEFTKATDGWNVKLPILVGGLYGLVRAFQVLRVAANGAKLSMGWLGVGLIAVDFLASAFIGSTTKVETNTEALIENANETKHNADELERLVNKYNKLGPQAEGNAEKQKELHEVLKKINDIAPQLIDNTSKYGEAMSVNSERATSYIATLKEMNQEQLAQAKQANDIQLNKVATDLEEIQNKLKNFGDSIKDKFQQINAFESLFDVHSIEKATTVINQKIEELGKKAQDVYDKGDKSSAMGYQEQIDKLRTQLLEYKEVKKKYAAELSNYSEIVNNQNGLIQDQKALLNRKKAIDEQISGQKELANATKANTVVIDEETGEVINNSSSLIDLISIQRKLADTYESTSNTVRPLNDAIDKMQQGHSLTSSEVSALLKKYPTLFEAFKSENGYLKINVEALKSKRDAEIANMNDTIKSETNQLRTLEESTIEKLKLYGVQVAAIESVSQAQSELTKAFDTYNNFDSDHEMEMVNRMNDLGSVVNDTMLIAKAKDTIKALQNAASNGFRYENSINTPKDKKDEQLKESLAVIELEKEIVNSLNETYEARLRLINIQKKQVDITEKQKDYNGAIEKTNELITNQIQAVNDLSAANGGITSKADEARMNAIKNKDILSGVKQASPNFSLPEDTEEAKQYVRDYFDLWFDSSGNASEEYKKFINTFAERSQQIHDNTSLSVEDRNKEIEAITKQKTLVEKFFTVQQVYKQGWAENINKIDEMTTAIDASKESLNKLRKEAQDIKISGLDNQIKEIERTLETLPDSTAQYRDELQKIIQLNRDKQNVEHQAAEGARARIASGELSAEQIVYENELIQSLSNSWWEYEKVIQDTSFKRISSIINESAESVKKFDDQISISKERLGLLKEESQEYSEELQKQIKLLEDKLNAEIAHEHVVRKQMDSADLTEQKWNELNQQLKQSVLAQIEIATSIKSTNQSLQDQLKTLADNVIDIYKEMYQKQKDVAVKGIEDELKALEKAHKTKVDLLDDEMKKYDDLIQAKLKSLDETANEEDYQKQLSKLTKERDEIQKEIDKRKLDTSLEGKARTAELLKELQEKNDEIDDFQTKNLRETSKKTLQDQLEEKQNNVDAQKQIEDKAYENEKDRLDKIKEATEKHFDDLIQDETKFEKIREEIRKGNISRAISDLNGFKDFVLINSEIMGNGLSNTLIDKISKISTKLQDVSPIVVSQFELMSNQLNDTMISKVDELISKFKDLDNLKFGNLATSLTDISKTVEEMKKNSIDWYSASPDAQKALEKKNQELGISIGASKDKNGEWSKDGNQLYNIYYQPTSDELPKIQKMKENSAAWSSADSNRKKELEEANRWMGEQIGATYKNGTWFKNDLPLYHNGGIVGGKGTPIMEKLHKMLNLGSDEQLSILKQGELVIKNNPIDIISNLISKIKLPDFSNLSMSPNVATSAGANYYSYNFRIDKVVGDKKGATDFVEHVFNDMKNKGKR
ncbi:hypothetical protein GCM10023310_71130 [Paenibacillus vulneris]|uniref:Phage tail tape measure protein n=1 Tax=Paenibacillus vulneris TaxID=1133364 RepID=A0ABW3UFW2_9BACL